MPTDPVQPERPWPQGYDFIERDSVDSTMAEAARLANQLDRPTWILAHRQTAAKGRQGRAWSNPNGNFAATLLMRPTGSAAEAALRSFLAANALLETLSQYVDPARLSQKWPNDVLLDGGKIAGILLESMADGHGVAWLSIGIGVNLCAAPDLPDAAFAPTALSQATGQVLGASEFLQGLAASFAHQEAVFAREGFAPLRQTWLNKAARLGEVITARTPREDISGIFETIDAHGSLILNTPQGPRPIPAADIYF
ncbi:MAG: biotin--[acetyl-CoA-carboxylase] ligase [Pseudomonadota bacterium]